MIDKGCFKQAAVTLVIGSIMMVTALYASEDKGAGGHMEGAHMESRDTPAKEHDDGHMEGAHTEGREAQSMEHDDEHMEGAHAEGGEAQSMENDDGHMAGHEMEGHGHSFWVAPPEKYAAKRNPDWSDNAAAIRGMKIFAQQCAQCHGISGSGDGPLAAGLVHKPADLSQHFHARDGISDAYLFWRVSEGGTVEPFKSANSAMPAFKEVLTKRQRWDVLTFIHQRIHEGFKLSEGGDEDHAAEIDSHG